MKTRRNKRAFTLVELLIVIAIIGVLIVAFLAVKDTLSGKIDDLQILSNEYEQTINEYKEINQ